jgi:ubiquinone/menaquinone biosynthesis C-methylase UbiE
MNSGSSNAKPVPSDVYTREYFLKDRKGSIEFVNTRGYQLCAQHAKALELANIRKGDLVLDIGCGCGELVFHSALKGARAVGIDYAPAAIELAEEARATFPVHAQDRVQFVVSAAEQMELPALVPSAQVDIAFLMDVLEHLHPWQVEELYRQLHVVLKPGGRIIGHTWPNRWHTNYTYPLVRRLLGLVGIKKRREVREKHDEIMHVNEQSLWSVWREATRAGFKPRVWMEHEPLNTGGFFTRGVYASFHQWPPFSFLFADDIWCVATKPD